MRPSFAGALGLCTLSVAAALVAPIGGARSAAMPGSPATAYVWPPETSGLLDLHAIEGAASVALYMASGAFRGGSVNPTILVNTGCKYATRDKAALAALMQILATSVKTSGPYPGRDSRIGIVFEDAQGKKLGALYSSDRVAEPPVPGYFVSADGAETVVMSTKDLPDQLREWRKRADVVFEGYASLSDDPRSARAQGQCLNV